LSEQLKKIIVVDCMAGNDVGELTQLEERKMV
jgi:hypothetical protein